MKLISATLVLGAFTPSVFSTFVLLPLYIYPSYIGYWNPVYSALSANPSVKFQIIINPNSGPGTTPYPNSDYITGISKLRTYPNVQLLGYVATNYTARPYLAVTNDISTYAGWSAYPSANISMDGIFFDEATASTSSAAYTYMQNASSYAYDTLPSSITPVIFNPGVPAPINYFSIADTIVEFEGLYTAYKNQTTINTIPSGYKGQSAIVVHDAPSGNPPALASLIHNIVRNGVGGVYFTNDTSYQALGLLGTVAADVAKG